MNSIEHHYQMLGLEPGASGVEIKQAYRDLVVVWHPDRFPENSRLQKMATEKLKEVNLAYEKLMEYVESSWYENLFGFEDEEFSKENGNAADTQPDSQNNEVPDGGGTGEAFTMKGGSSADAEFRSESAETEDWFKNGGENAETAGWLDRGYDSLKTGRLEEAISYFDKALEINPRLLKTWAAKGLILEKLGQLEEALECFDRTLEIDQGHEDAWIAKGNILYSLFKNQEALDCYDRALAIDPKNAEVWYRRWVASQKAGKFQEIPDSIGKALETDPANGGEWYQRAVGSEKIQYTFSYRQPYLLDAGGERSRNMPNDLIGDLSETRLFNIVKSLVDWRKSGMVVIEGKNAAELYIEGGSLVHGKANGLVGEEAILAIMDLDEGRVTFNWQLSPEKRTVRTSTEQLMSIWNQRDEEWRKVRKVMASSDAIFSIVLDSGGEDRTIPAKQWSVLALCNGERNVSDIAGLLGQSVLEMSKTIGKMVDMGLLVETGGARTSRAPQKEIVNETFFTEVETELKKVMGPIARVIINDTLAAFEESREAFPRDKVETFIRTVSDQIIEEQKRSQFEKACYKAWIS